MIQGCIDKKLFDFDNGQSYLFRDIGVLLKRLVFEYLSLHF
jgi:hypothetical protein